MERFHFIPKDKLNELPKGPGVYALAQRKTPLYIGKAANIQERVKNHFSQPTHRDYLFLKEVTHVGYLRTDSDIEALLTESQLIKKTLPKYNVMWKDDKGYFYVGITKEKLPRVFLTHQIGEKIKYVGPFVEGKAIKQVLRLLRRTFPYYTAKKHGDKPCSWCHLGLCPGPNPNQKAYKRDIKNLIAVLQAKKTSVLKSLKQDMEKASKAQNYEEAAKMRDQLQSFLRVLSHASVSLKKEEEYSKTEQVLQEIFSTKNRMARVEAYDISNTQGKEATGSLVVFIAGRPAKEWYRKFKIHITGKPNDFAMLQETISRRLKHAEWPYPDLMIIDGGKPQLSAAIGVMTNFERIKVAAIAKQHNELFLPGAAKPILLKTLPLAVQNVILHIRDEAHRFAITYHKHLRKRRFFANTSN